MFSEKHVSLNTCGVMSELLSMVDVIGRFPWLLEPFGSFLEDFFDFGSTFDKIFSFFIVP